MNEASVKQQLQMLREQTRLTGGLHEAQVYNLKLWPLVLFDTAKRAEFTWDPDKKVIFYTVVKGEVRLRKKWLQGRTDTLGRWVRELLGNEWKTYVEIGNFKLWASENNDGNPDTGTEGSSAQ